MKKYKKKLGLVGVILVFVIIICVIVLPQSQKQQKNPFQEVWKHKFGYIRDMGSGDFNNDGFVDLIVVERKGTIGNYYSILHLLLGNGKGAYAALKTILTTEPPKVIGILSVGDLNRDSTPDFAMVTGEKGNLAGCNLTVFLNDGVGNFTKAWSIETDYIITTIVISDFNEDCLPDIIVGGFITNAKNLGKEKMPSGRAYLFLNNGNGTVFTKTWEYKGNEGEIIEGICVAKLNDDNFKDVIMLTESWEANSTTKLIAFLGTKEGILAKSWDSNNIYLSARHMVAEDFDSDGDADIITDNLERNENSVMFFQNDGSEHFKMASKRPMELVFSMDAADIDSDGNMELVLGNWDGSIEILSNYNASFEQAWKFRPSDSSKYPIRKIITADVNNDQGVDIIVVKAFVNEGKETNTVYIFLNNASG